MVYKEKEESMERVKDECKPVMLKHIVTRDMCKSLVIMVAVNLLLLSVEGSHYNHRNHRISSDERQSNHKNCSRCSLAHEDVKSRRIEQFKREFLQKLGLKEEPKIQHIDKSLYNIPPLLHTYESTIKANNRLTNKLLDDEMMLGDQPYSMPPDNLNQVEDESTIKKIISFANPPPEALNVSNDWNAQYFQFSPSLLNLYISRATLWINVRKQENEHDLKSDDDDDDETSDNYPSSVVHGTNNGSDNESAGAAFQNRSKVKAAAAGTNDKSNDYGWIVIDQVRSYTIDGEKTGQSLFHVRSRRVHIRSGTSWVRLSVKKLVNQWIHAPKGNLGLVIHIYDSEGRILPIGSAGSVKDKSLQVPFVEMKMDRQIQNRFKRRVGEGTCDTSKKEEDQSCCVYPFKIDFKEFGWDWVLAPESYDANYCTGKCTEFDSGSTSYAHLLKQARGSHSSCCVPKKTSQLHILYMNERADVISEVIPDMSIEKCGCA